MTPNKVPQYTAFRVFKRGFQIEQIGLRKLRIYSRDQHSVCTFLSGRDSYAKRTSFG